jgi:hypothetical protein
MKTSLFGVALATALIGVVAISPQGAAAQNQNQQGLVNVAVGDVTILENVGVGVAAQVAAAVCGVTVQNVNVLASTVVQQGETATVCEIGQGDQNVPVTIEPGEPSGGGQGPNQRQSGLLNVAVGDVTILRNVGVGVAAQVAATICGVTVENVNVLAAGVLQSGETATVCEIMQGEQAVPVTIGAR